MINVTFILQISSLSSKLEKHSQIHKTASIFRVVCEFNNMSLGELSVVATLGLGGFGRVELVKHNTNEDRVYALKVNLRNPVFFGS